jgi:hypothetical protein
MLVFVSFSYKKWLFTKFENIDIRLSGVDKINNMNAIKEIEKYLQANNYKNPKVINFICLD